MDEIGEIFTAAGIEYELAGEPKILKILIILCKPPLFWESPDCEATPLYEYHDGLELGKKDLA